MKILILLVVFLLLSLGCYSRQDSFYIINESIEKSIMEEMEYRKKMKMSGMKIEEMDSNVLIEKSFLAGIINYNLPKIKGLNVQYFDHKKYSKSNLRDGLIVWEVYPPYIHEDTFRISIVSCLTYHEERKYKSKNTVYSTSIQSIKAYYYKYSCEEKRWVFLFEKKRL